MLFNVCGIKFCFSHFSLWEQLLPQSSGSSHVKLTLYTHPKMAPPWKTTARKRCVGSPYIIPDKDSDPPHRKNTSAALLSMGWLVVPDVPLFAGGGPRLWSIEAKNRPYHEILRMKFLNFISIESSVWIKWASSRLRELQVLDGVTPVPGMRVGWYMASMERRPAP